MNSPFEISDSTSSKIRNAGIVCAFLVVLIHSWKPFKAPGIGWWMREILGNGVAHIAVPFFFSVTGYMLARDYSSKGYGPLVAKRIHTLMLPFIIWNFLFWVVHLLGSNAKELIHGNGSAVVWMNAEEFGLWYTGCPMLTPLWYVRAIFVLSLTSPLLLWCIRKLGAKFLVLLYALYGACCPYWPVSWGGGIAGVFPCRHIPCSRCFLCCHGNGVI